MQLEELNKFKNLLERYKNEEKKLKKITNNYFENINLNYSRDRKLTTKLNQIKKNIKIMQNLIELNSTLE